MAEAIPSVTYIDPFSRFDITHECMVSTFALHFPLRFCEHSVISFFAYPHFFYKSGPGVGWPGPIVRVGNLMLLGSKVNILCKFLQ